MPVDTLPPHTIRRSNRARKIGLVVHPKRGLEIVLPRWASEKEGVKFLKRERVWVQEQLDKLKIAEPTSPDAPPETLPETIVFSCVEQCFELEYVFSLYQRPVLREVGERLLLIGKENSLDYFERRLLIWLRHQAHRILSPWLQQLSEETGLAFNKVSYRNQSTRWGSCSVEGNISLNYKLLFLPADVVRYVLIHELCHTKHMNHGKRFWSLVKKHVPNYAQLIKQLDTLGKQLPSWLG